MDKIVFFHPIDDYYGATRILSYTINVLSEHYEIEVWTRKDNGALKSMIDRSVSIKQVSFMPIVHSKMFNIKELSNFLVCNFRFFSFMKSELSLSDTVYINTFAAITCSLLAKLNGFRNVIHCHEEQGHKFLGRLMAFQARLTADKIISVSNVVENYVSGGKVCRKSLVIWNGIPDIQQPINLEHSKNSFDRKFRLIIVARLTKEKGYWLLAEAVRLLPSDILDDIEIHCVGDAPINKPELFDEFKHHLQSCNVSRAFVLHGFQKNVDTYRDNADVVLIPSVMVDPFPTTVLEAMRSGKCLITTDHGGAAEIVKNNENGLLFRYNSPSSLSNLIAYLYRNREDVNRLGKNARKTYQNQLTIDVYSSNIKNFLAKFLKEGKRSC
ncbi:glycosyltransferase family 4 protein [Grimontia hollisae]|uniref:glycosyltransferase family 4 protein n=1 Tax=Grimontia hollisae TaxID=673 RepID=UPI000DFD350B|nr:glycosyltransferase family 4 protein [Grimontia hollisae]STQ74769.1 Spore coat protein SA [Grimontia hollisae]